MRPLGVRLVYDDGSVRMVSSENARAQASTARTSASEAGADAVTIAAVSAASITRGNARERQPARRETRSTATSLAAFSTIGHAPPCSSAS